jgi:hypothetical protein
MAIQTYMKLMKSTMAIHLDIITAAQWSKHQAIEHHIWSSNLLKAFINS